jgi:hypothetical protein
MTKAARESSFVQFEQELRLRGFRLRRSRRRSTSGRWPRIAVSGYRPRPGKWPLAPHAPRQDRARARRVSTLLLCPFLSPPLPAERECFRALGRAINTARASNTIRRERRLPLAARRLRDDGRTSALALILARILPVRSRWPWSLSSCASRAADSGILVLATTIAALKPPHPIENP